MMPARRLKLAAVLVLLVLAAPLPAQESPLAMVPDDAVIVFHLRGLGRTKERLVAMAKNAAPDLAPLVQGQIDSGIEKALSGRKLKGLAPDGSVFLILLEMPQPGGGDEPKAAVIARVTNYGDFRDGILKEEERKSLKKETGYEVATTENDKQLYFVDLKEYVVVTPRKDVAESLGKKPARGLETKLGKEDAGRLLEPDLALYVDMAAVNKAYGPIIQLGRGQADKMLDQFAPLIGQGNEGMIDLVKAMTGAVFQTVEDSQGFLLSTDFRPQGLALHLQVRVGADSKTNQTLKRFKIDDQKQLGTLPAGEMIYTGMQFDAESLKKFEPILFGVLAKGADGQENKAAREALDQLVAAGPRSNFAAVNIPAQGIQVWHYDDPAKAVEAQRKLLATLDSGGSYQFAVLKAKPEIKADARSHRGFKLSHLKLEWDLDKMAARIPGGGAKGITEATKKLVGEGLNIWFGTDGKTYVQLTGKDWKDAQRFLDAYLDGTDPVGKQKAFLDARRHLPARTSILVLFDIPPYVRTMMGYMAAIMKSEAGEEAKPPAGKATPSYLGLAITLQPGVGSLDLWLPGSAVGEIRKAVEAARGGGGQ